MAPFETAAEALEAVIADAPASKLSGIDKVVMFDLAGEGGGQWTAKIADGQIHLLEGSTEPPNTTFKMKADVFLGIANGKINPVAAFMQGRVRVQGDMSVAMRLQTLFM
jgi:putative sterol carrier protein